MSALKPQIGVSLAVLHATDSTFLLVKRANAPSKGMWAFPGGRLDFGERLADGAARELHEETGLVAENIRFFDHVEIIEPAEKNGVPAHHFLLCVHTGSGHGTPIAADDAEEARWCSLEEMSEMPVTDSTLAFAKRIALAQL